MDVSRMSRMMALEDVNRGLKKMYLEEQHNAEIVEEALKKSGEAISQARDGKKSSERARCEHKGGLPAVRHQRACYRYERTQDAENAKLDNWLLRLTDNHRNCRFGLCYLHLRNVSSFQWNHKSVYRIYKELELNLRIKPRIRLVRDKPVAMTVREGIIKMCSMDFMHDQIEDGRAFKPLGNLRDRVKLLELRSDGHAFFGL